MVPVKEGAKYLTGNSGICQIVVAKESDSVHEIWKDFIFQEDFFALYDSGYDYIFIEMQNESVSEDYITAVLIHEAVHAIWRNNCAPTDYNCRANDETVAFLIEFAYLDYIAAKKNSGYNQYLQRESQKLIESYLSDGQIEYPDWDNPAQYSEVRQFFDSSDAAQDKRWYSLLWMRKYQEGFFREFGSENGYRLFVQLISSIYY
jgi:hypothetical protein